MGAHGTCTVHYQKSSSITKLKFTLFLSLSHTHENDSIFIMYTVLLTMFVECIISLLTLLIYIYIYFSRRVIITQLHEDNVHTGDRVCLRSWDPVIEYNEFSNTDQSAANH